uniref:Reverse transcriptase n=1 Tax=Tanacetum cinerariifolium TaxID=118510 RepID=A0A699HJY5_TANCI|nr:reverse transcriptase [Tanacetum cinerariifolium]
MFALKVLVDSGTDLNEKEFMLSGGNERLVQEETGELIEYTPQISLHALSGVPHIQTMRVCRHVGKYKIHILIDSSSTHNFVDTNTGKRMGCRISTTVSLQVDVANGNKIVSTLICKQFTWQLQGETFVTDSMLVPLGGYEMVLGVQWLATLSGRKIGQPVAELSSMMLCAYRVFGMSMLHVQENEHVPAITGLLTEYADVFNVPTSLPPERSYDHKIPFREGDLPVNEGELELYYNKGHLVSYYSKTLAPRHQALSTYEKELLAIIQDDTVLQTITPRLKIGETVKHYTWTHDQLRRKGKLVVSNDRELRQDLLVHFHIDSVGGHSGNTATTNRISGICYWKKLRQDVKTFVALCAVVCHRSKPDLATYPSLLQPLPMPNLIWTEISMDFIEGLTLSNRKLVILLVVDRLSKYSHFIALSHPYTVVQVANAFIKNVYKLHRLPPVIVSDRDKTEVVNRCLETYLRCMTWEKPKEWSKWLSLAEYWYNTNFHTFIQTTPYEAVYGKPPPSPIAYVQSQNHVDNVDRSPSARETMVQLLKFHLQRAQQKMKVQADKRRTDRVFKEGQWVYLKLVGQVACKLLLPSSSQIHLVFHVSQLKLYKGPLPNVTATLPACDAQGKLLQQPVKVLDRRLGKVGNSAVVYVLIQWSNSFEADAT